MSANTPRDVEITVGYRALPGLKDDRLEKRTVKPADGDAPPWDANTKYTTVGSDIDRVDGLAKASGRAKYSYDVTFPGMLQAMILRSTAARGKLSGLELDEAKAMPGVAAVIALKEIGNKVRFVGDAVAAVAALTLNQCRDAIEKIRATYDTEEHNVDYVVAEGAPQLDANGEITDPWPEHAEVDKALAAAKVSHTGTYRTEVQTHCCLETHGGVAKWNGKDLDVWLSTQATFGCRGGLAQTMKAKVIDVGTVTVHSEFVGGGFGSKFVPGDEAVAVCLLAHAAQAPVKLMLDRFEEHTTTGNRPGALAQARAGVDGDGKIVAWDWRTFGHCGWNAEGGRGAGGNVALPDYYSSKAKTRDLRNPRERLHKELPADTDPARPMRAPGHPQGWFCAELFMDELAAKAGIEPLQFRLKNDTEQVRQDQWRFAAQRFGWEQARAQKRDPKARFVRGAGLASARWGSLGGSGRRRDGQGQAHGIACRIHPDGTVEVRSGAQDIGVGTKTTLAVLAAEELGVEPRFVTAMTGHTSDPSGPASGGSTVTPSIAPAVRNAAFRAKNQLCASVAQHLGVDASAVTCGGGKIGTADKQLTWTDACKLIGPNPIDVRGERADNYASEPFHGTQCGVQMAEVEVDTWTGIVRVLRMFGVQDCGLVLAKKLAESQVLGAMIQGVSYALHEQRIMDKRSGRMLNGDFLRYKITGPQDLPHLECHMHSIANGHTNVGAGGLGEPPSVASAAAIGNAVFHAIGAPVRHLPITPDKVLAAIAGRKG
ncbi:MAG TPA: xanthine dehydrogenase family protein molybdopterin-binding subunit [Planctomycetota bacterium]|nr:xanthine dehydrogenase family protein molybdopterin-binding subunit [Planctomycetota bacterium]